ncbi:MAG: hypothetical protein J6V44_14965 [Methanobrevibacter sp.]|nr:hypothetical protein [Methanobrevibacter sp.]MBO7692753.1 hypothetical protein [Methanobrevibacter sp.]
MEKIEPKDMTKNVSVFKDNAFRGGYPYKITIYDEDVRKSILNGIKYSYEITELEEILYRLNTSLENGVNVIFKELISNNSIAVFVLVTPDRNYDICIRIDHVEAQKTSDEIRMDDILKIEEFEED